MSDYINREDLVYQLQSWSDPEDKTAQRMIAQVKSFPAYKGRWMPINRKTYMCSVCGNYSQTHSGGEDDRVRERLFSFCPECGADMRDDNGR